MGLENVDWINLAQDRVHWRGLVNTLVYFRVPLKAGNFLTRWMAAVPQGGLWPIDLSRYGSLSWGNNETASVSHKIMKPFNNRLSVSY
jgi:hypothetical protein